MVGVSAINLTKFIKSHVKNIHWYMMFINRKRNMYFIEIGYYIKSLYFIIFLLFVLLFILGCELIPTTWTWQYTVSWLLLFTMERSVTNVIKLGYSVTWQFPPSRFDTEYGGTIFSLSGEMGHSDLKLCRWWLGQRGTNGHNHVVNIFYYSLKNDTFV